MALGRQWQGIGLEGGGYLPPFQCMPARPPTPLSSNVSLVRGRRGQSGLLLPGGEDGRPACNGCEIGLLAAKGCPCGLGAGLVPRCWLSFLIPPAKLHTVVWRPGWARRHKTAASATPDTHAALRAVPASVATAALPDLPAWFGPYVSAVSGPDRDPLV